MKKRHFITLIFLFINNTSIKEEETDFFVFAIEAVLGLEVK